MMVLEMFLYTCKITPEAAAFLLPGPQKNVLQKNKLSSPLELFPANPIDFTEGAWVWRIKSSPDGFEK